MLITSPENFRKFHYLPHYCARCYFLQSQQIRAPFAVYFPPSGPISRSAGPFYEHIGTRSAVDISYSRPPIYLHVPVADETKNEIKLFSWESL